MSNGVGVGPGLRFEILKRDRFRCVYCGARAPHVRLQVDHVVPVSLGGKNDPSNLVTACATCNIGKSDVPLDEVLPSAGPVLDGSFAMFRYQFSRALRLAQLKQRLEGRAN